ncbi:MAG: AlpA family phage regulatory protein [Pseudomonadota bacterium]
MELGNLLTCKEVMRLAGIRSRTTIWRRIRRGSFPNPIDIGGGRIRWRSSDIEHWISDLPVRRY